MINLLDEELDFNLILLALPMPILNFSDLIRQCYYHLVDKYRVSHGALASAPLFTGLGIQ
jgi:hypothetical protein